MHPRDRTPDFVKVEWVEEAQAYLRTCYPNEGCGVFSATGFKPVANLHADPANAFEMSDDVFLAGDVLAVIHSHPDGNPFPSKVDMQQQAATDVPWAIALTTAETCERPVWYGDCLPVAPLLGREFVYGIFDCYALIRDWHRLEGGRLLREFPRDWAWWEDGKENMYEEGFRLAGFEEFDASVEPLQPGDVFLGKLYAPVLNHGGVYAGDGMILHHVMNTLSRRAPLNLWANRVAKWLRYKG